MEVEVEQSEVLSQEEVTQVLAEGEPEGTQLPSDEPTFEMPEKMQGKSLEEVTKMYVELEKMKAKQVEPEEGGGDDVSGLDPKGEEDKPKEEPTEYRICADQLINKSLELLNPLTSRTHLPHPLELPGGKHGTGRPRRLPVLLDLLDHPVNGYRGPRP